MEVKQINQPASILSSFIAEMRDVTIQKDPLRFRHNLLRIGEIFAYEISKTLTYEAKEIKTPLGQATEWLPQEQLVLISILRAGVPFHNGILNFFIIFNHNCLPSKRLKQIDLGNEPQSHLAFS